MKILECKQGRIYDIGFVDPDVVHGHNLKYKPNETEDVLVQALKDRKPKGKYYFLTTSGECYFVIHIRFAYSMLSVIDELYMHRFHYILLIITPDKGLVQVMDPLRNESEKWKDLSEMLQR